MSYIQTYILNSNVWIMLSALNTVMFFMVLYVLNQALDLYGVDWKGPLPMANDENTMVVTSLPPYLSAAQQEILHQQLPHSDTITEEWMIHVFSIAKVYVKSVATM